MQDRMRLQRHLIETEGEAAILEPASASGDAGVRGSAEGLVGAATAPSPAAAAARGPYVTLSCRSWE